MEKNLEYKGLAKQKLSKKLLISLAYCLFIVGVLTLILNYYLNYQFLEKQLERRAQSISQGLEFATEGLLEIGETSMSARVVQNYATLEGVLGIVILDPNGKTIAYAPEKIGSKMNLLKNNDLAKAIPQTAKTGIETTLKTYFDDQATLVHLLPFSSVLFAGNPHRGLAIVMLSLEQIYQQLWQIFYSSLISLLAGIFAILVIVSLLIDSQVIKPINKIYEAIIYKNFQDNFNFIPNLPPNEIKFLAWVFKKQFDDLNKSHEKLKEEVKERRLKEEELRHAQEILQLIMDNIPQNIFWKDCQSVYLGCNKNFLKIANATCVEEIVGKTDYDMCWREYSEWFRQCDRWVMDNDTPKYHIVEQLLQANGKLVWVDTNKVPLHDAQGKVTGVLGTFEDITARKMLEEEKEKALAREREISAQKSRFINIVSHEFRNPLTVILASAQLLENYEARLTPEKKLSHIINIKKAGDRLKTMINDLLLISQAESGQMRINYQNLNLKEFCLNILEEFKQGFGKNHLFNFKGEGFENPNLLVNFDEKILRYILNNLLSNAVKYSNAGSCIDFQVEYKKEEVIFEVSDEGIGIPVEEQSLIFNSFYRGQNVSDISGTGLGLHIVKKCLDIYGGEITLTSVVNCGSNFQIKIPLTETGNL